MEKIRNYEKDSIELLKDGFKSGPLFLLFTVLDNPIRYWSLNLWCIIILIFILYLLVQWRLFFKEPHANRRNNTFYNYDNPHNMKLIYRVLYYLPYVMTYILVIILGNSTHFLGTNKELVSPFMFFTFMFAGTLITPIILNYYLYLFNYLWNKPMYKEEYLAPLKPYEMVYGMNYWAIKGATVSLLPIFIFTGIICFSFIPRNGFFSRTTLLFGERIFISLTPLLVSLGLFVYSSVSLVKIWSGFLMEGKNPKLSRLVFFLIRIFLIVFFVFLIISIPIIIDDFKHFDDRYPEENIRW